MMNLANGVISERYGNKTMAGCTPDTRISPLRAAEFHLALTLKALAEGLRTSSLQMIEGHRAAPTAMNDIIPLLEELDGRNRGLLIHFEDVHEYERRRERFPLNFRNTKTAATAILQVHRRFLELHQMYASRSTTAPLLRMVGQVNILLMAAAHAIEHEGNEPERITRQVIGQVAAQCREIDGIIADLIYVLPNDVWQVLDDAARLLKTASEAIEHLALDRYEKPSERDDLMGLPDALLAGVAQTPVNRLPKQILSTAKEFIPDSVATLPTSERIPKRWLAGLLLRRKSPASK